MRRVPLLLVVAVVSASWAAPAGAAQQEPAITLGVTPAVVGYGSTVTFAGAVTPARAEPVTVLRLDGAASEAVASGVSRSDGAYELVAVARAPGSFVARTASATSPPVGLRMRPLLKARWRGLRLLGAPLWLKGTLRPAAAGRLTLAVRGSPRTVRVDARGAFRARIGTQRAGRVCASLALRPATGFVSTARRRCARIEAPTLAIGSRGPAVGYLERRLADRRYALRGVDRVYRDDTRDAVLAFQKVEGLVRDGVAGPAVWRALRTARTPRPVGRGRYIEVQKGRQVLFEVRKGRVVRIVHVSTGATGNTPVGRFRVYGKEPGYNALGMYYSLYFLRGFAIHGYASVPPYPASHGCVRLPLWFAPGLYSRWPVGARVTVVV